MVPGGQLNLDKKNYIMIKRFGKNEIDAVVKSINKASLLSGYTNKFLGGEILQKFEKELENEIRTDGRRASTKKSTMKENEPLLSIKNFDYLTKLG